MMTTTDRLAQLINKLNKSWRKDAKKAIKYLMRLLAEGVKTEAAIAKYSSAILTCLRCRSCSLRL